MERLDPTMYGAVVLHLCSAIKTVQLHGPVNQATRMAVDRLLAALGSVWRDHSGEVTVLVVDDFVMVNDIRLQPRIVGAPQVGMMRSFFAERGLGGISFAPPLHAAPLSVFIDVMAAAPSALDPTERLRTLNGLHLQGVQAIEPKTLAERSDQTVEVSTMSYALQTYARAVIGMKEVIGRIRAGADPLGGRIQMVRVVQDLIDIACERLDLLLHILEQRTNSANRLDQPYAPVHAANTCLTAIAIGRVMGLDRVSLLDLGTAALFADIGFAVLPEELTERAGLLSPSQYQALRTSMTRAAQTMIGRGAIDDAALRRVIVAYEHHAPNLDPGTERRSDRHPYSRIVAVADAFDALVSGRPWRAARSPVAALAELVEDEARFDPAVVRALASLRQASGSVEG
ncbi:MAG: hypothetical protein U1E65_29225 [Myxococcota bacterium]